MKNKTWLTDTGTKALTQGSVADLEIHGSETFAWIRNYWSGSGFSKK